MEGIFLQLKIPSSGYTPGWPPGDALWSDALKGTLVEKFQKH